MNLRTTTGIPRAADDSGSQHATSSNLVGGMLSAEAFTALVNRAGRQRMLSQRIVLCATLAAGGHLDALVKARSALNDFRTCHTELTKGAHAALLAPHWKAKVDGAKQIETFIHLVDEVLIGATNAISATSQTHLHKLQDIADPVLTCLNDATLYCEALAHNAARMRRRERSDLLEQIGRIASEARVVSLNARVIAARAGEHGREFSVVAGVLTGISEQIEAMVKIGSSQ